MSGGGAESRPRQGGPVTAIVHAGGPHVLPLLGRVEELLREVAAGHGAGARRARGVDDRRRRQAAAPAAGDPRRGRRRPRLRRRPRARRRGGRARPLRDARPRRRARPRAAAPRRPTVFAAAGRAAATQTGDLLFARAFALLAANGDPAQVRALSDAGSALARGRAAAARRRLGRRRSRWSATCTAAS